MEKKNVILIVIGLIILVLVGPYIAIGIKSQINKDILTDLKGEIYYTKRDDSILTLYKSDASLDNEKLIYSHKNKGYLNENDSNDNIIDFHYDENTGEIDFIAMKDGNWNLFSIKEGEENPKFIGRSKENLDAETTLDKTDYINNEHGNLIAFEEKGSIYVEKNGEEKLVKDFHGIYDRKFTGYVPIGFSPDGKYLIYSSMEHLTPIGSLLHHLISGFNTNIYIMDLKTGKSARFIESYDIQWIIDGYKTWGISDNKYRAVIIEDDGDKRIETWGVGLNTKNITSTELTLICYQSDGKPTGELQTGSYFF